MCVQPIRVFLRAKWLKKIRSLGPQICAFICIESTIKIAVTKVPVNELDKKANKLALFLQLPIIDLYIGLSNTSKLECREEIWFTCYDLRSLICIPDMLAVNRIMLNFVHQTNSKPLSHYHHASTSYASTARYCFSKSVRLSVRHTLVYCI